MGTIRDCRRKDGSVTYHAEVHLNGYPSQRGSFRTRTLAKKWIQDIESSIKDGRHFRTAETKRHTVKDVIDRFTNQWLPQFPHRIVRQTAYLAWRKDRLGHLLLNDRLLASMNSSKSHPMRLDRLSMLFLRVNLYFS